MNNEFGMKELYFVQLKTTLPIEINGKYLAPGEVVASFDKLQIANFQEIRPYVTAHGGYEDRDRVFWETTKGVEIVFSQGIFSKEQFSMMYNARLWNIEQETFPISQRDFVETNEEGILELTQVPKDTNIFIYNKETGEKLYNATMAGEKSIKTSWPYTDVIVDYEYICDKGMSKISIGQRALSGFLSLEGRTRVKDDITGTTKTGIFKIPKLKLTSDLSLTLGTNANPQVGRFEGKAIPIGPYGKTVAMELYFLSEDIDTDSVYV